MKIRRRTWIPLGVLILSSALVVSAEIYRRIDYEHRFVKRKGRLVAVSEQPAVTENGNSRFDFRLEDNRHLRVEGSLKVPSSGRGPYPVLLMLGGLQTGKEVVDYIPDTRDVILVALDYPYIGKKGKQDVWEFLTKVPTMREAMLNTVPAVMLAVDYLLRRSDVDPERIILIGGSIGALFGPAVAAADSRIDAVVILFGAGNLQSLIYVNTDVPRPFAALVAWLGATLVSPVEPLKYIDRISPRPLLMINGTNDPRMPVQCCLTLHEKAGQPKTIRWIEAGHLHVRSPEFHEQLRAELIDWLDRNGLAARRCFHPDSSRVGG
jgi:predicted esterase